MPDLNWNTISSLATAGGTLVLGVATFAAVRSSNRSARISEQALRVGMRPLLVPSRLDDPQQKVFFGDGKGVRLPGGGAAVISEDGSEERGPVVYLAISLRNAGSGIAVLRSWHFEPEIHPGVERPPDPALFRRHSRDLYIPPHDIGFWQGALRDADDGQRDGAIKAISNGDPVTVDMLYSDHEGGQPAVSRFVLRPRSDGEYWLASVVRHWNLDRPDPR